MKRNALTSTLLLVLCSLTILSLKISVAKTSGSIYIRADGNVEPSDVPIQRNGSLYTLTDNITSGVTINSGAVVIERNNITLDGIGYAIQGTIGDIPPYGSKGIHLCGRSNVTIKNTRTRGFDWGIYLNNSSNNSIFENIVTDNNVGIYLFDSCCNNTISKNNITNNNYGIYLAFQSSNNTICRNNLKAIKFDGILPGWYAGYNNISGNVIANSGSGIFLYHSPMNILRNNSMINNWRSFKVESSSTRFINDVDTSNTIEGKPVYYWIDESYRTVPIDAGYIALINCTCITVENLNLAKNGEGVLLAFTTNSTITKNNITDNERGIYFYGSSNNRMLRNNIKNNTNGILLYSSSNNNNIVENNITENNQYGIWFDQSSNNTIYHNNFVHNAKQVEDSAWLDYPYYSPPPPSINVWDNGSAGNYWSDYNGNGSTPYIIDANNQDHHTLTTLYGGQKEPTSLVPAITITVVLGVAGGTLLVCFGRVKKRTQGYEHRKEAVGS